jgi:hypothetical protein
MAEKKREENEVINRNIRNREPKVRCAFILIIV